MSEPATRQRSPISQRVRARLAELGVILTGEEPEGVRLRDCAAWPEAAAAARERYRLTDEQIAKAGATIFPSAPRFLDPAPVSAVVTRPAHPPENNP